jgi:ribose transport system substrate-binding protein
VTISSPHHVGVSYFEQPFLWKLVAHELDQLAKTFDLKVTVKKSRSVAEQVTAVGSLIDTGIEALVIAPIVPEIPGLLPLLSQARLKGVVTIMLGMELYGAESLPVVRGDTPSAQRIVAEHVFQHLGGRGSVAYIRPIGNSAPTIRRVKAFYEAISRYPNIELVKDIVRDWTPLEVKRGVAPMGGVWAQEIMREHPETRAIFAPSDNVALGAIEFLERKRLAKDVIVTGFDASPAGLHSITRKKLFATVALPARDMADQLLRYAVALLQKKAVPGETLLPAQLVTRANADEVMASILTSFPKMKEMKYW